MKQNYLAVKAFVYFGYNYPEPKEFIHYICEREKEKGNGYYDERHLLAKFSQYYDDYGSRAVMNKFFVELSSGLQESLVEYACKVYYPNGFYTDKEGIELLNGEDKTADEIAYRHYLAGEYSYADYVAVCEAEECEPLPEK